MKKPKNPEKYIGKRVRMIDKDLREKNPLYYPKFGTVGTITGFGITDNTIHVDWGKNSGVGKNFIENNYAWAVAWSSVELVDDTQFNMTDEEIWEMFKPKIEKLGINYDGTYIRYPSILDKPKKYMDIPTVQKLVATVYRSGYGRGQKGRPFMIGEKKKGGHWEWIKPDEIVPDGTKVRYMKRAESDDGLDPYYPTIGQECIKLNPSWWSDSNFWVQFEGSEYEYTCLDSHRDCFQKWVEE